LASLESDNELGAFPGFIVFAEADERLRYAVMGEQFQRVPGVLGRNQIDLFEGPQGPKRQILEVSDGGGDDVQGAGHGVIL
jgi:hypothetical protein